MITSLVLALAGDPVVDVWDQILSVPEGRNVANIINNATRALPLRSRRRRSASG